MALFQTGYLGTVSLSIETQLATCWGVGNRGLTCEGGLVELSLKGDRVRFIDLERRSNCVGVTALAFVAFSVIIMSGKGQGIVARVETSLEA